MIPDLTNVVSPETRKMLYTIWVIGSAILFVSVPTLAVFGLDQLPIVVALNALWNGIGVVLGGIAKSNTPTSTQEGGE